MSTDTVSALEADLSSGSPDARYRAISYIGSVGGPAVGSGAQREGEGPMSDQVARARQWLDAHVHDIHLLSGYSTFRRHWSPIFKD